MPSRHKAEALAARRPSLLDALEAPIPIGAFLLRPTSVEVTGTPPIEEFQGVYAFATKANRQSGFWLADLCAYFDSREDWKGEDAVIDIDTLTEASARQYRYIAKHVPPERRVAGVPFGHHAEVAGLEPAEQTKWLKRTQTEGWSQRELRDEIRASKRVKLIAGHATLKGMYRVWLIDPPWEYHDSGATADGSLGKAKRHYQTMSIDDLCALPVKAHALPNAVLFLWVTAALLMQNPGPREVLESWGFLPKTGMVWHKGRHNFGHYVSMRHEHVIIATRGSCLPDHPTPMPESVFTSGKHWSTMEHSEKPEELAATIEKLYDGPYVELFARRQRPGWTCLGNDFRLTEAVGS